MKYTEPLCKTTSTDTILPANSGMCLGEAAVDRLGYQLALLHCSMGQAASHDFDRQDNNKVDYKKRQRAAHAGQI